MIDFKKNKLKKLIVFIIYLFYRSNLSLLDRFHRSNLSLLDRFHRSNLSLLPIKPVFIKVIHTVIDCKSDSYKPYFAPSRD